jgi:hypothetical protein
LRWMAPRPHERGPHRIRPTWFPHLTDPSYTWPRRK